MTSKRPWLPWHNPQITGMPFSLWPNKISSSLQACAMVRVWKCLAKVLERLAQKAIDSLLQLQSVQTGLFYYWDENDSRVCGLQFISFAFPLRQITWNGVVWTFACILTWLKTKGGMAIIHLIYKTFLKISILEGFRIGCMLVELVALWTGRLSG